MKIGLNAQMLLDTHPAGPEKYTISLYNAISEIDTKNEYIVYFPENGDIDLKTLTFLEKPNFKFRRVPAGISWTHFGLAIELFKDQPDIYFTPVHTMPIFRPEKTKVIGMIHGLEYTYAEEFKNNLRKLIMGLPEKYVCENADLVIVPSIATREAIMNKGWKTSCPIVVIPEGVSERFFNVPDDNTEKYIKKYDLEKNKYLIFISTIQPRKNIPTMVKGFSNVIKEHAEYNYLKLVIVGKNGWLYDESLNSPSKYNVKDNVKFLGRLDDYEVPALLNGALAYINCTLEEGFGLPLLEALAAGKDAIVSDIPSHREIADNLVYYVDPKDDKAISEAILKVLSNPTEKDELKIKRASLFSWKETALKTLDAFERARKDF